MPQPTAVMQVEGVLRKPVGGAPIESGRRLYHGLSQFYHIVLVTEENDHERIGHWLGMHSFTKHDHIVYSGDWCPQHEERWVSTAGALKLKYGYDTDLFIIPDPHDAAALIEHGYNTLLFTIAAYALPEWRPDHRAGVRPWEELVGEIMRGRAIRAADKRMDDDPLRMG